MALLKLLNRLFHGPPWLTFLFMGVAAGGFALCSFNLLCLFQANFNLIATYGAMAAFDGGILQFIELTAWGYLALACYVVFKGCLDGLLQRIHKASARLAPIRRLGSKRGRKDAHPPWRSVRALLIHRLPLLEAEARAGACASSSRMPEVSRLIALVAALSVVSTPLMSRPGGGSTGSQRLVAGIGWGRDFGSRTGRDIRSASSTVTRTSCRMAPVFGLGMRRAPRPSFALEHGRSSLGRTIARICPHSADGRTVRRSRTPPRRSTRRTETNRGPPPRWDRATGRPARACRSGSPRRNRTRERRRRRKSARRRYRTLRTMRAPSPACVWALARRRAARGPFDGCLAAAETAGATRPADCIERIRRPSPAPRPAARDEARRAAPSPPPAAWLFAELNPEPRERT